MTFTIFLIFVVMLNPNCLLTPLSDKVSHFIQKVGLDLHFLFPSLQTAKICRRYQMTVQILILSQRTNTSKNKTARTKKKKKSNKHFSALPSLYASYSANFFIGTISAVFFFTFIFFKLFFFIDECEFNLQKN